MANRSVMVTLRAEIGQYKAAMTEASKATKGVSEEGAKASAEGKSFVDNWSKAATPLLAVGGAITALGVSALKTGISYNQLQQQSRAALTTILGSAEAANAQMDKLDEFARTSPFSKQTFISAQQQMLAFGIEAQKVIPYLDAIQDAVAASGGGNADIAGVVATMSKVQSSAKLTAEDLNELGNRGINAAELIGSQMGKTGAQIREEITAGTLGADVALDALAAGMEQRFDGAAENVKNTFTGALDRVSAAWRDLSSELAEPFVGKEGGGIFTALVNESADFLRAVQDLPGPVKGAAAALTGLVGVTSLAAGAYLAFAPRILATKTALAELAASGSRAAVGMQKTGAAAKASVGPLAIIAGALIAVNTAFELLDRDSAATVEDMTSAILDLAQSTETLNASLSNSRGLAAVASGYTDLGAAAKEAHKGTSGLTSFMSGTVFSVFGTFSALNPYGDAMEDVKAYDEALTGLVTSGATEEAAAGFEQFAKDAKDAGLKTKEIEDLLPGYTAALKDADNQTRISAEGTKANAAAQEEAAKAQEKAREAAVGQAKAFLGLGASVADAKVSLGDWIGELEKQSSALRNFTDNAIAAANKGLREGLIAELREAGPEGALRMKELADASEKEIARANKAWGSGKRAVGDYADVFDSVPQSVITQFDTAGAPGAIRTAVEVAEAANLNQREVTTILEALDYSSRDINKVLDLLGMIPPGKNTKITASVFGYDEVTGLQRSINALTGKTVVVRVVKKGTTGGGITVNADGGFHENGVKTFADGGFDEFGRPVSRVPQIRSGAQGTVMWGEPETGWEAYVSGKPSQKPRNRAILSEAASRLGGNVEWFADGGFTEAVTAREFTSLRIRVRDLQRALKETEKTKRGRRPVLRGLDRLEARQELAEAKAELAEQRGIRKRIGKGKAFRSIGDYNKQEERRETASSFASDFDSDAFRSPASLERALANKLRESAEFTQTLAALRKKGASKWLIEQLIELGPSRSTNRTAKALLTDTARLRRLNAMSTQLGAVSNTYASVAAGNGLSLAQSRALSTAANAGGGSVNLSAASVHEVATAILAGSRNVSVRTVDDREYMNAGASRYPSPLAGVRP